MMNRLLLALTTILLPIITLGQDAGIMAQLEIDEKQAIEAIALYPLKERTAILEAALYPEVLVRMQNIRKSTAENFQTILSDLSEDNQKKLYDISRYPELVSSICKDNRKKSDNEITTIIEKYPEQTQQNAIYANKKLFESLKEIDDLYSSSDAAFQTLISKYPQKTRDAYMELVKLPEVITTLNDYMGLTVLLGDVYQNSPEQLQAELDSLNIVVSEQKARELNEWKQSLEEDPEAMAEYEQATQEFASEQGINTDDYQQSYSQNHTSEVYIYHVWRPYPYWFGPPWWDYYDYWYPYPWWYHCGYYYGPNHTVYFVGLPSYYFVHWHMYHHHHFYHYPHLTDHMISYYYGHRNAVTSVTTVTENWIHENYDDFPKAWLKDDGNRVERIREYGKFKMDYEMAVF